MNELPKTYNPKTVEGEIYALWERSGAFNPDQLDLPKDAQAYSIVLPPPNATGQLHLGHAMYVVQDIMIRHARMQEKRTLWLPGTDHAAIAVNALVEKQLRDEGKTREQIGREAFLKRVSNFIETSQGRIKEQLKRMGFSLDWSREAFTMDESRSEVVQEVFKRMFEDGLIYRGIRVINWDPLAKSTISDDEVQYKEQEATLYTFRYANNFPIAISSTRPETKVGDTAVAVHPSDERYQPYIGKHFDEDFAGTKLHLTVVADEGIDPKFGTGALGVTPSHSMMDAEIAKKNKLPYVTVIQEDGRMTEAAGTLVAGLEILAARKKVVEWLRHEGLLEKEEIIKQNLSISERSGAPVEPLPKEQWFIDVNKPFAFHPSSRHPIEGLKESQLVTLKQLMRHVVKTNQIQIIPERFKKTYFQWIDNLRDWNISRQIWFGHQVPVWYKGKEMRVGGRPSGEGWTQDPDTLDTWFSSATWTFSTLGWPKETEDFKRFHPTSVLETGYDILFFWVARMILMTTYALGEVPFKTVYLHGLVRDKAGAKMSKSKGNGIDPLAMIEKYGTDALRLALVTGTTPGNDTRLYEEKIEGYRNFINKFWNIARYILTTVDRPRYIVEPMSLSPEFLKTPADAWIESQCDRIVSFWMGAVMDEHRYGSAIEGLYQFTWNDFADWYLEIAKIEKGKDEILLTILSTLLRLWHPYAPFITEHIYQMLEGHGKTLMVEPWPTSSSGRRQSAAIKALDRTIEIVSTIRQWRAELKIPYSTQLQISGIHELHSSQHAIVERLGRVDIVDAISEKKLEVLEGVFFGGEHLPDLRKHRALVEKELVSVERYIGGLQKKCTNPSFVEKAPPAVVAEEQKKLSDAKEKRDHLLHKLQELKNL